MHPRVLAICLTANRVEMTRRAVASFVSQTYQNKKMLIWDSGELSCDFGQPGVVHVPAPQGLTIGSLRNAALSFWTEYDIAITFDSDDWSHANRISEQVAYLQSSGADCVGFDELLFWLTCEVCDNGKQNILPRCPACGISYDPFRESNGEAWLYSHNRVPNRHAPGTSFCYWRKFWERNPFKDLPKNNESTGEDVPFLDNAKLATRSAMFNPMPNDLAGQVKWVHDPAPNFEPRMICSIHGGNTMHYDQIEKKSQNWRRAPEFDKYCRKVMAL